jgi:GNAT superfamily N-acetyltransferase
MAHIYNSQLVCNSPFRRVKSHKYREL